MPSPGHALPVSRVYSRTLAATTRCMGSGHVRQPSETSGPNDRRRYPPRPDGPVCFAPHPSPARSAPTPEGRSRQEPGTMCAGRSRAAFYAIPLAVGRPSHAGGSSAPLRSAPRRGASRGSGFEGALRRTARSPVVARTVSHGSEPLHTSTTRTRVEYQRTPLGHRRGNAFRRQSDLFRSERPDPHNRPTRSSWSASPWARPAARERQLWIRADRHRGSDPPPAPLLDPSVPAVNIRIRARLPQHRQGPILPCG